MRSFLVAGVVLILPTIAQAQFVGLERSGIRQTPDGQYHLAQIGRDGQMLSYQAGGTAMLPPISQPSNPDGLRAPRPSAKSKATAKAKSAAARHAALARRKAK